MIDIWLFRIFSNFQLKRHIEDVFNKMSNTDRVYFDLSIHSNQSQLFTFSNSCLINWIYWISTERKKKEKNEEQVAAKNMKLFTGQEQFIFIWNIPLKTF